MDLTPDTDTSRTGTQAEQVPTPAPAGAGVRLAARMGQTSVLLDMNHAGEIISTPPLTPVPWTRPWFRGLCNLRGRLIGVIDLPHFAGEEPIGADQAQQLIVLNENLRIQAGLLITRAYGLRNLATLKAVAPLADPARPWETALYEDAEGATLKELDILRLVAQEAFNNIGF